MHRLPTEPKHHEGVSPRALDRNKPKDSKIANFLQTIKSYVWPSYGASTYTTLEH